MPVCVKQMKPTRNFPDCHDQDNAANGAPIQPVANRFGQEACGRKTQKRQITALLEDAALSS